MLFAEATSGLQMDPRRIAMFWALAAFVVTALVTRMITRRIRAGQGEPVDPQADPSTDDSGLIKDIHIGGVHVHHQVWGILMILLAGLLLIVYRPAGHVSYACAALFGAGAALALDEFAMWLHVEDVYWSHEGRKSITAMMTATVIFLVLVLGSNPFGLGGGTGDESFGWLTVALTVTLNLALAFICILKGKNLLGLIGVFVTLVGLFGAIRLAKPGSWWARRRYSPGSRKSRRSTKRFGERYEARWRRMHDLIGGSIDTETSQQTTPPPS